MTMIKPKIFISSTIYDFFDLRSALKYYLETMGYEVMLSEYNDFSKSIELNSYEACMKAIETADYFILLIGSRVGGWYDKNNRISITQMEYRKAYQIMQKRNLKIINIVRENIWLARNERKKLKESIENEYMARYDISQEDIKGIVNYKSEISNDTDYTFNFINEIAHIEEMKKAQIGKNNYPRNNWVHSFKTFNDIIDIIKSSISISDDRETMMMKENIKVEIIEYLKLFFARYDEKNDIYPTYLFANELSRKFDGSIEGECLYDEEVLKPFVFFLISSIGFSSKITMEVIRTTLNNGIFMIYNKEMRRYEQSNLSKALQKLNEYVNRLKSLEEMDSLIVQKRFELVDKIKKNFYKYQLDNILVYTYLYLRTLQEKIIDLSMAIIYELDTDSGIINSYDCNLKGPSKIIDENLNKEKIGDEDIVDFYKKWTYNNV